MQGRRALETLRGDSMTPDAFELEWIEMVKGIEAERRLATTIGPLDMFKGSDLRRTMLCWAVISSQTASGSWFLISYSTYFMVVSGLSVANAFRYSIMKTCIGFLGVGLGMYLMRHVFGRRTIMLVGCAVQGLVLLAMAIAATVVPGTVTARNSVVAFVSLFVSLLPLENRYGY